MKDSDKVGPAPGEDCTRVGSGITGIDMDSIDLAPLQPLALKRTLCVSQEKPLKAVGVAWHSNSKHAVGIDQTGAAILWDTTTKRVAQYISRPHSTSVAVAPTTEDAEDKAIVAIGGLDNAITLCDMKASLPAGEVSMRLPAVGDTHDGLISSLAFLDDARLASAGGDGDLRLWNLAKGESTDRLRGHSRDLSCVVAHRPESGGGDVRIATSSVDGTVRLWDARAGGASHIFECAHAKAGLEEATAVCFFPTGDAVAAGCGDGSVRIFDLRSTSSLATIHAKPQAARCTGIDFSLSGRGLYTSHEDGTIGVWELYGKSAGKAFHLPAYKHADPLQQPIVGLRMAPNGVALAVACYDSCLRVYTAKQPSAMK